MAQLRSEDLLAYFDTNYDRAVTLKELSSLDSLSELQREIGVDRLRDRISSAMTRLVSSEQYGFERLADGVYRRSSALERKHSNSSADTETSIWETLSKVGDCYLVKCESGEVMLAIPMASEQASSLFTQGGKV